MQDKVDDDDNVKVFWYQLKHLRCIGGGWGYTRVQRGEWRDRRYHVRCAGALDDGILYPSLFLTNLCVKHFKVFRRTVLQDIEAAWHSLRYCCVVVKCSIRRTKQFCSCTKEVPDCIFQGQCRLLGMIWLWKITVLLLRRGGWEDPF